MIGVAHVSSSESSLAGYALAAEVPVIVQDARAETRFENWKLLRDHAVVSSIGMVLRGIDRPFGVWPHTASRGTNFRPMTRTSAIPRESAGSHTPAAPRGFGARAPARTHARRARRSGACESRADTASRYHEPRAAHASERHGGVYVGVDEGMGVHGPLTAAQRTDLGRFGTTNVTCCG